MRKAFVRASEDPADCGDATRSPQALPPGTRNYLTSGGYRRLRAELQHLLTCERPTVTQTVSWAAANGDRSENADYIYGKKRLREIDRRIRFLTKRLELAEVVDPAARPPTDQVYFGATVVYAGSDGRARQIRIVGVDEVDPQRRDVSWVSPIARAVLKARAGDSLLFLTPSGPETLQILAVRYEAEEAGVPPEKSPSVPPT